MRKSYIAAIIGLSVLMLAGQVPQVLNRLAPSGSGVNPQAPIRLAANGSSMNLPAQIHIV